MKKSFLGVLAILTLFLVVGCSSSYRVTTLSGEVYYAKDRPEIDKKDQVTFTDPNGKEIILERDQISVMEEADIPEK